VGSEFQFIRDIKSRHSLGKVGDDCAILPGDGTNDLLITADMLVEGVDFRLNWSTPEQLGHKALAVSLSDIAAMGGKPTYALLSVAVAEKLWKTDFLDRFYVGWHELAGRFDVELVGGDISRTDGPLTFDSTVLGRVPAGKAVLRSGARVGDGIYVSGPLGGAAAGLKLLEEGGKENGPIEADLVTRLLQPEPHIDIANYLITNDLASAMIDLSDGLSSDLHHLCSSSDVGAVLIEGSIPIGPGLVELFGRDEAFKLAVNGGEDFVLLFTSEPDRMPEDLGATRIGTITADSGHVELLSGQIRTRLDASGFSHF
jgi:thiamine-monophosphate kinase